MSAMETHETEWRAGKAEWMVIIVLSVVSLMVALDATILVTALPTIANSLHGTSADTFWAGTSYLLTEAVFQPFIITLSDNFGRRLLYLMSLASFTIGTLICCLSQNFTQLLTGRTVQGIGGGGILALGYVILTDIVPLRQRPLYTGIIQIAWAIGSFCGPLIGGIFTQHSTWRWVFYINFPFAAIGFVTVPVVLKLRAKRASLKERLTQLDWIGGALFIGSTTSFLIGVTWGGQQFSWDSWRTLLPIILGAAGFVATIAWEKLGASKPFIRLSLFNSYSAFAAYFGTILQGLLLFCELYYLPFYLETVKDYNPTLTGVALMPLTASFLPTSILVGKVISKFGKYRWAVWLGWLITIACTGLLVLLDVDIKTYAWVLVFIANGVGHGFILMSLNMSVQAMADAQDAGVASAIYVFTRVFGMCLGVAVGGTMFQNRLKTHLIDRGLPAAVANNAEGFVEELKSMKTKSLPDYEAYIQAYADSFQNVFEVLVGIAALGGILSIFMKEYSMDKKLGSDYVLDHVNHRPDTLEDGNKTSE